MQHIHCVEKFEQKSFYFSFIHTVLPIKRNSIDFNENMNEGIKKV